MDFVDEWQAAQNLLQNHTKACLVMIQSIEGSSPREAGAWMLVADPHPLIGSIGGGQLEWQAHQHAQTLLTQNNTSSNQSQWFTLGTQLGQCCGGRVQVQFVIITHHDWSYWVHQLKTNTPIKTKKLALFGAGHVGRAVIQALHGLPFEVLWVDSRENRLSELPKPQPTLIETEFNPLPYTTIPTLESPSYILIMTHSHQEDWDLVHACVQRHHQQQDLPYVGLIGSHSKWMRFQHRLAQRGWQANHWHHIQCPIGLSAIPYKTPAAIAIGVVAQLLMQ